MSRRVLRDALLRWLAATVMVISAASTVGAAAATCPDGSAKPSYQPSYRFGDNFYRLTPCKDTWANSQAEAQRQRGNLTSILDIAENQWIFSRFGRPELGKLLWIGLTGGNWVDGSGTAVSSFVNNYPLPEGTAGCAGSLLGTMSTFSGGWVMQSTTCPTVQTAKYGVIKIAAANACVLDIDSDGQLTAALDGLAWSRVMAGFTGAAIGEGLAATGSEATGAAIADYLKGASTPNPFGSATTPARVPKATSDGLVLIRLMRGMTDAQLLLNIPVPAGASNPGAAQIRASINAICGTSF